MWRIHQDGDFTLDIRLAGGATPGHHDLRLGAEKDVGAVELRPRLGELGDERALPHRPAPASRDVHQRGAGGENDECDEDRQASDVLVAEIARCVQGVLREGRHTSGDHAAGQHGRERTERYTPAQRTPQTTRAFARSRVLAIPFQPSA